MLKVVFVRKARFYLRRLLLEAGLRFVAAYVFLASRGKWRAWARNSLALGYCSESSDLDITLFSRGSDPLPVSVFVLARVLRRCGEWAAFSAADREWAEEANPLELARDPRLVRELGMVPRQATRAECFVFWLRMSGADKTADLDERFLWKKERKWRFHLRTLERESKIRCKEDFPAAVTEMGLRLSPVPSNDWEHFRAFFRPQEWLKKEAIPLGISTEEYLLHGPQIALDIARCQLRWELWGLLGQMRLRTDFPRVENHFRLLSGIFPAEDSIRGLVTVFCATLKEICAERSLVAQGSYARLGFGERNFP
jgi:hypothetical protein